jgi:nucleoid DNA-binding protein
MMDELIKQVTEKTGISEDQARTAVNTVITFLKSKLPEPIAGQIDSFTSGTSAGAGLSDVASKVGGMFK